MKLDIRDSLWIVVALVLFGLLGLEWRRAALIAADIRVRNAAEAPLELVNAKLAGAINAVELRYKVAISELDWQSLKPLGL